MVHWQGCQLLVVTGDSRELLNSNSLVRVRFAGRQLKRSATIGSRGAYRQGKFLPKIPLDCKKLHFLCLISACPELLVFRCFMFLNLFCPHYKWTYEKLEILRPIGMYCWQPKIECKYIVIMEVERNPLEIIIIERIIRSWIERS